MYFDTITHMWCLSIVVGTFVNEIEDCFFLKSVDKRLGMNHV